MKINKLDAHDRLLHFQKQADDIQKGVEECKYKNPLSLKLLSLCDYIYIFAHKREIALDEKIAIFNDDLNQSLIDMSYKRKYLTMADIPTFRILWQPRLSKPEPQTNSMLFRCSKFNPDYEVMWIIPPPEMWTQYKKGNMTGSDLICESIYRYKNKREEMASPEKEDVSEEMAKSIYKTISGNKPTFEMI